MQVTAIFESWHIGDGNDPPLTRGALVRLSFELEPASPAPHTGPAEPRLEHGAQAMQTTGARQPAALAPRHHGFPLLGLGGARRRYRVVDGAQVMSAVTASYSPGVLSMARRHGPQRRFAFNPRTTSDSRSQ